MVTKSRRNQQTIIVLRPNRSASWMQTKWFLALISFFVFTIALGWTFAGAWVILPFAGIEVGLLCLLMYKVSQSTYQQQVIVVSDDVIEIQAGYKSPSRCWQLVKEQAHLKVKEGNHPYDPHGLYVADDTRSICVGHFLNREDTLEARDMLQSAGLMICNDKWWKNS